MKIFVTGGTGLIGRALVPALSSRDHEVLLLTRDAKRHEAYGMNPRVWMLQGDPMRSGPWQREIDGVDVVIHLASAPFFSAPWTPARRGQLLSTREQGTREVVRAIQEANVKPKLLLSASSVGIYGEVDGVVTEDAPVGEGFLADLCRRWEHEAALAAPMTHVVNLRFGQVIAPRSALLRELKSISGLPRDDAPFSWVHVNDAAGAILSLLTRGGAALRVNVTSPEPASGKALREALGLEAEKQGLFARLGRRAKRGPEDGGEVYALSGQRAVPSRLLALGYNFRVPRLDAALAATRTNA